MLADTTYFCAQVAYAHFLGLANGQCFTTLQSTEDAEGLGFWIDKLHGITFLYKK